MFFFSIKLVNSKIYMESDRRLQIVKMILKNRVHALVKIFRTRSVEIVVFLGTSRPRRLNRVFRNSTTHIRKFAM